MNISFNKEEFERLLIKNWTVFLDPREIIKFVNNQAQIQNIQLDEPIRTIKLSKCTVACDYSLGIWIEFNAMIAGKLTQGTVDAYTYPTDQYSIYGKIVF